MVIKMSEKILKAMQDFTNLSRLYTNEVRSYYTVKKTLYEGARSGLMPYKGSIILQNNEELSFRLHGGGCEFKIGVLTVDVNYAYLDTEIYLVSGYGLSKFLGFAEKEEYYHDALHRLEIEGFVKKISGFYYLIPSVSMP